MMFDSSESHAVFAERESRCVGIGYIRWVWGAASSTDNAGQ
jgi:hypothetical protein